MTTSSRIGPLSDLNAKQISATVVTGQPKISVTISKQGVALATKELTFNGSDSFEAISWIQVGDFDLTHPGQEAVLQLRAKQGSENVNRYALLGLDEQGGLQSLRAGLLTSKPKLITSRDVLAQLKSGAQALTDESIAELFSRMGNQKLSGEANQSTCDGCYFSADEEALLIDFGRWLNGNHPDLMPAFKKQWKLYEQTRENQVRLQCSELAGLPNYESTVGALLTTAVTEEAVVPQLSVTEKIVRIWQTNERALSLIKEKTGTADARLAFGKIEGENLAAQLHLLVTGLAGGADIQLNDFDASQVALIDWLHYRIIDQGRDKLLSQLEASREATIETLEAVIPVVLTEAVGAEAAADFNTLPEQGKRAISLLVCRGLGFEMSGQSIRLGTF